MKKTKNPPITTRKRYRSMQKNILESFWVRIPLLIFGMFCTTIGIAIVTNAALGTTPISTLPLTMSSIWPISFGMATFIVNLFFLLGQVILLGKRFPAKNILQLPVVILFSFFIDLSMHLVGTFSLPNYFLAFIVSICGNFCIAAGIVMQVRSKTMVQPGEGIVLAVAVTLRKSFGSMKMANDISLVILAALLGWAMLGHTVYIREGTLVSAFLVGFFVKLIEKYVGSGKNPSHEIKVN